MAENRVEDAMATEAPLTPITAERKVRADLEDSLPKPYLARAFAAPDTEHPDGTPGREHHGMTVLQQHVAFFDQDKNGLVYPHETFRGLRDLGINVLISFPLTIFINLAFSLLTKPGFFPSPLLPIYIKNIHNSKHGSSSGTYDMEGRFIPVNFENIFSKYAKTKPGKLTLRELWHMTEANRVQLISLEGQKISLNGGWFILLLRMRKVLYQKQQPEEFLMVVFLSLLPRKIREPDIRLREPT